MFARTERLLLRPGWVEDAPALTEAFARDATVKNSHRDQWPYPVDDAASYLGRDRKTDEADLLIFQRTMGPPRLIGGIGLAAAGDALNLGYWIVSSHWGLGFATEAGHAVVAMARDTLRISRLVSVCSTDNSAAARVLAKLGFTATEHERHAARANGSATASVRMALDLHPMAIAA